MYYKRSVSNVFGEEKYTPERARPKKIPGYYAYEKRVPALRWYGTPNG